MSNKYLLLRLDAPMQSWGVLGKFDKRPTENFPTKSGVVGILAAAAGVARGDTVKIKELADMRMTAISCRRGAVMTDYHTVTSVNKTTETRRDYLTSSKFLVLLEGPDRTVDRSAEALMDPVYPLFLGRKCCIPAAPILVGVYDDLEGVKGALASENVSNAPSACDASCASDTERVLQDVPVNFETRVFTTRRVAYGTTKSMGLDR